MVALESIVYGLNTEGTGLGSSAAAGTVLGRNKKRKSTAGTKLVKGSNYVAGYWV